MGRRVGEHADVTQITELNQPESILDSEEVGIGGFSMQCLPLIHATLLSATISKLT